MFSAKFDVGEAAQRIAACSCVMFTEEYDAGVLALGERLGLHSASPTRTGDRKQNSAVAR